MIMKLILAILTSQLSFGFASKLIDNVIANDILNKAALDIISSHTNYDEEVVFRSKFDQTESENNSVREKRSVVAFANVPQLESSPNFMHSYIADTGAGNREEISLESVKEERLHISVPSVIRAWNYIRYNSTDFVIAFQDYYIDVWRILLTRDIQQFVFDHRSAYCSIDLKNDGKIMHAMFFTNLIKHIEVLFFAITIETSTGFQLRTYEVIFGECVLQMQFNLHHKRPLRIGFVSSQYQSGLVLLFNSNEKVTQIKYRQKGHNQYTKLIEVYASDAIDMETFTINGFGYIAVANRDECQVYRLSEFVEHHILFDTINVHQIIDLKAFRLGFDHFLGIATHTNDHYIYVWRSGSFYPKQILNIDSVMQFNVIYIPTCRDDVIIHLLTQSSAAMFLWNGQMREFRLASHNINALMRRGFQVLPFSQSDFSYNDTAYVLQVDTNGRSHLISIRTRLGAVPDPILLRGSRITDIMNKLKERFLFQQSYIQTLSESLKFAMQSKSNGKIKNGYNFKNLEILNDVIANKINSISNIVWQNSPLTKSDLKFGVNGLTANVLHIKNKLETIEIACNDIVLKNKPSIISGNKKFTGKVQLNLLNTTLLKVNTIGRQNLNSILGNLYCLSRPQIINGLKHFVKPIYSKEINARLVNGIDLRNQIVTTNTPQLIRGRIRFNSYVTIVNDLIIKAKINNIDLNDIVFLNYPETIFKSKIFISPITMAHNVNALSIDGIDLSSLVQNVLFTSGKQVVNSLLLINQPFYVNIVEVDGLVNNVDISAMANNLVYVNRNAFIKGKKSFIMDNVYIKNNLIVLNNIDSKKIPNDLFIPSLHQIITGRKYIKENVIFKNIVTVKALIDGLSLPQDIVQLTNNETIFGPIIFPNGIIAVKNIDARKLVDGVDISELKLTALKMNDRKLKHDAIFNQIVIVGQIDINGNINNINLNHIFNDVILKGSDSVQITGIKQFIASVEIVKLISPNINHVKVNDFVLTTKNETIAANILFASNVFFADTIVKGLIDKTKIEELYNNRISLSEKQRITGSKHFLHELRADWLILNKSINGILPETDIAIKSKFQEIYGTKIFNRNLYANNLNVKNSVTVRGKIDNILMDKIVSRTIKLNENKSFSTRIVLIGCNASFVEIDRDLNGMNVTKFANNIMSLTRLQTIIAPKMMKNKQYFSWIQSSNGLNRVKLNVLNENAVHLNGGSRITQQFTFNHLMHFERSLLLNGVVNGVNLSYIANDAVYKSGAVLVKGRTMFKSGFRVNGNINALSLNGIDLTKQLLTKSRNHTLSAKVIFSKTLNISKSVPVIGNVNGIDLSQFKKDVLKTNVNNLLIGDLELIPPTNILNDLNIAGKLNGINLNEIFNNALFIDGDQEITGVIAVLASIHFRTNLNTGIINDMKISMAIKDLIFTDSTYDQYIFSPKIFTNNVIANGNAIQLKGQTFVNTINRVNLLNLIAKSIRIDRPILLHGVRYFSDNAVINANITQVFGTINGINLMKDVIHLHSRGEPQIIRGHKVFSNILLLSNASVKGLVNDYRLQLLAMNTLNVNDNQYVKAPKAVKQLVSLNGVHNIIGTLNGMRINEELVTLINDDIIFSELIFQNSLSVKNNLIINGLLSGENLTKLLTESMFKDIPQLLSAPLKFNSMHFLKDIDVIEHVDNVDLSALSRDVKHFTSAVNISKDLMLASVERHKHIADYLYNSSGNSLIEIDNFILYQLLDDVFGDYITIYNDQIFSISAQNGNLSETTFIRYNPKTEIFDITKVMRNQIFINHKLFYIRGQEFMISLSSSLSYNISSQLTKAGQLVGSFGLFVSSIEFLFINDNVILFTALVRKTGKLDVYLLESRAENLVFKHISSLIVGSETTKVVPFLKNGEVFVVVSRNYLISCASDDIGSVIYLWHNNNFKLIQRIALLNVADMVHFENYGKHYLAFSDNSVNHYEKPSQSIYIYRSNSGHRCSFSLLETLHFENTIQLSTFSFGSIHMQQSFLLAGNQSHVLLWKQEGESGFTKSWSLRTKNFRVFSPICVSDKLFIIVAQNNRCEQSQIFKAEIKGTLLTPLKLHYKST